MNSKRRKTISRQTDISDILTKYEALTQSEKIATLQYHLLEIGTLTKNSLSPEYFDCLPPLTELELETEQNDPTVCISFSSFLDETNCSVQLDCSLSVYLFVAQKSDGTTNISG